MISFNVPLYTGKELNYVTEAVQNAHICGDGVFTKRCSQWFVEQTVSAKVLLTTSCTHALEMSAMLADIHEGDEVIMPSYTFVSTANAFVLRGAKIVFVDVHPETMNINEKLIEAAVTPKTKAIVPVHYAGVGCEMDKIQEIADKYNLLVIEDAAQGVMSTYKGQTLGAIGDFGCYSFHETKNYTCGEGGALLIQDSAYAEKAEIIREKGTDRSKFYRGEVDKYSWQNYGSSYLPSELNAAYLWAQLEMAEEINQNRLASYGQYDKELSDLAEEGFITLPFVPEYCTHNAHMFFIKVKDIEERSRLMSNLKEKGIGTVFHYIPLHSSVAGQKFGRFHGEDVYTTKESERLLRLPMHYGLKPDEIHFVTEAIKDFYKK